MTHVVYIKETTIIASKCATEAAAKAFLTRTFGKDGPERENYGIAELNDFTNNIEKSVERVNLMTGKKYMEPINTPVYMSPARESYWSM